METIDEIPRKWAYKTPAKECLTCLSHGERRLTWEELNNRINKLANSLLDDGYEKGDQIGVMMKNCHEMVELYYACFRTGVVPVPLNYRFSVGEFTKMLEETSVESVVVGPEFFDKGIELAETFDRDLTVITAVQTDDRYDQYLEDLVDKGDAEYPEVDVEHEDIAILLHTGGTTGLPKGVPHTHRTLFGFFEGIMLSHDDIGLQDDSTVNLYVLPLFHISLWPIFVYGYLGARNVLIKEPNPGKMLDAIESEGVNTTLVIPTVFYRLIDHSEIDEYDLSSMELVMYGGAPFHQEQLENCIDIFGNIFSSIYGATEGVPWTFLETDELEGERIKSVGKEALVADVRIYHEDEDEPVPQGEEGEIVTKSPGNANRYWKQPEKTEKSFTDDGFFRTGDIGRKDEDGFLYILDRKSDMIITGGENVYPTEVENTLNRHGAVAESAVVGVEDPDWGEKVVAAIVVEDDYDVADEERLKESIESFCKDEIAGYKCPKEMFILDALPTTEVGKIQRTEVESIYAEGAY